MNDFIEVQKDDTAHVFTYAIEDKNGPVIPSTATIEILRQDGTVITSSTAMTIDGTTGKCTYTWDSTGQDVGKNYQVKYTIDGKEIIQFFDIYYYPFINFVTESDLFLENDIINGDCWEVAGKSKDGTTNTVVDPDRQEVDDEWNGGLIEIYQDDNVYERKITDFSAATGTITFTPALDEAVEENEYSIRKSYYDQIAYAGNIVQLDFKNIEKRAYLVIDHVRLKYLIVYKFFENFFQNKRRRDGDENDIQYQYYAKKYIGFFESMSVNYDKDMDGEIEEDEEHTTNQIHWYR